MILLAKNVNKTVNKPEESNLEMVNRRRDKDYIRKVIRINPKYIVICDFLDFYTGYKEKRDLWSCYWRWGYKNVFL